jgi:hypothetical protein
MIGAVLQTVNVRFVRIGIGDGAESYTASCIDIS